MKKVKVIIADDSKINNEMLIKEFENDSNIEILGVAEDGIQEYELIKKFNPDLVITDNQMPNMTGVEVIQQVSKESFLLKPKFILVSGDSFKTFPKDFNVIRIFGKPVNYDVLKEFIVDYFSDESKNEENIQTITQVSLLKKIKKYFMK